MKIEYSALMAVKNGEKYIKSSIESMYNQTLKPEKVIIINDHSTDKTVEIVKKFAKSAVLIDSESHGQAAALNLALQFVQTPYVAFLDYDDIWLPFKNAYQLDLIKKQEHLDAICGGVRNFIDPTTSKVGEVTFADFYRSRQLGSSLFKIECFTKYGKFKESSTQFPFEWWSNAVKNGISFKYDNQINLLRRIQETNKEMSESLKKRTELLRIIRSHVAK